jgi:transposase
MVARHYDVNANQVFSWRRLYRDDPRMPAVPSASQLIPVMVTAEQDAVTTQASTVAETIEIDLAGKYRIRVSSGVDAAALRRVLDVLERRR